MAVPGWLGNYQVVRLLGTGGMGEVYLAREPSSAAERAVKTLRGAGRDSELWQRFVNEGRVLSQLSHPNISTFYDMFLADSRPCLVMEYVDGETLFDRIQRTGRLEVEETLAVLGNIVDALCYLRRQNVLHRDLKSANIKISSKGQVKLLDFGIAKVRRTPGITAVGSVMGTPDYLSPEQAQGAPADTRSEIWMVGLLAYEMLTGHLPFRADSDIELYRAIRGVEPPPPSSVQPAVPSSVDRMVMRCLEKDPARRFQTPEDLLKAIQKAVHRAAPSKPAFLAALSGMAQSFLQLPKMARFAVGGAALLCVFLLAMSMLEFESVGGGDMRTITIDVVEGRAQVYQNGSDVGRTPYRVRAKVGESIQLELRRAGFADQSVQFDVSERKTYSYTMQPVSAR